MTRQRLRPAWGPEQLAEIYPEPHQHDRWPDHVERVKATSEAAGALVQLLGGVHSAADLSCGDGTILDAVPAEVRYFGDFAPGYEFTGPIETTLTQLPSVDLFVCTETIEHLDDPDIVLAAIRERTRLLVLSTPVDAWNESNPEHYWAWSRVDVEEMLAAALFTPVTYTEVDFRPRGLPYCFGIWGCR